MNEITTRLKIDIYSYSKYEIVNTQQGDNLSRTLEIELLNNGDPYNLSDGLVVELVGKRPDNQVIYETCTYENNIVTYIFTNAVLGVNGKATVKLVIRDDDIILSSIPFYIFIGESPFDEDKIIATQEFSALNKAIVNAQEANEKSENILSEWDESKKELNSKIQEIDNKLSEVDTSLEDINAQMEIIITDNEDVQNDEAVRISNETSRINAENTRISNETVREEKEITRNSNETLRINTEQERINAENERITNENNRVQVEQNRVSSESIREENEEERISNEDERKTAEINRDTSEAERSNVETIRKANETTRETNESVRETNEIARETAESLRETNEITRQTSTQTAITNANNATTRANNAAQNCETLINGNLPIATDISTGVVKGSADIHINEDGSLQVIGGFTGDADTLDGKHAADFQPYSDNYIMRSGNETAIETSNVLIDANTLNGHSSNDFANTEHTHTISEITDMSTVTDRIDDLNENLTWKSVTDTINLNPAVLGTPVTQTFAELVNAKRVMLLISGSYCEYEIVNLGTSYASTEYNMRASVQNDSYTQGSITINFTTGLISMVTRAGQVTDTYKVYKIFYCK